MTLTIESGAEAEECRRALAEWVREGLRRAGYLQVQDGEDSYYTVRRRLLAALDEAVGRS